MTRSYFNDKFKVKKLPSTPIRRVDSGIYRKFQVL